MSNDLIKRLHNVRLEGVQELCWEAAYRIEELEESNKELTLQLLAVHGQAADALDRAVVAEAKLAKAVEALRFYAPTKRKLGERWFIQNFGGSDDGERAAAVLAELEGGE
jgi:hypothetical protein